MKRSQSYLILAGLVAGAVGAGLAVRSVWQGLVWVSEPLHSTVEALGGFAAIAMVFVLLQREQDRRDGQAQMLALGFLGMGLLEGFHAVAPPGDAFVLLRIMASFLGGFGFALVWLPVAATDEAKWKSAPWLVAAGAIALGLLTLVFPERLPGLLHQGEFAALALVLNGLASMLFLAGAVGFLVEFRQSGKSRAYLFACLALLFGTAELMLTTSAMWDSGWWYWHLLRLVAYGLVLWYVSQGYLRMVADLRSALARTKRSERRLAAQYAVTRVLAESPTLKDAGRHILQAIGGSLDWELGMFWSVDEPAELLRFVDLWHAPQLETAEFVEDSRERTFQRGAGLIGRVWDTGKPIWIPDVAADPNFRRAPMAARVGLHGGFAFPLRKGDRVYGVMEFFSHEIREPDRDLLDMVAEIGIKIGQFVDREQTEETLRQTEAKLQEEARLAEVARVVGDIGHDLKNLLMPVITGASLLEAELNECYAGLSDHEAAKLKAGRELSMELLGMIQRGSRRIQGRVQEIADSVKGLSIPPRFEPCRVATVVAGVIETLRILADQKQIALRVEGLDALPTIRADENRLFNAFYNLINNAIPEVPAGGSITVRGRVGPEGKTVVVSVEDTGRGMSLEVRDSLFTYRALSKKTGGTGLGTKIVKDVVDAHGGRITVESQEGVGTTFHLTLPIGGPSGAPVMLSPSPATEAH
jgi:signal transduction histidine kinase